MADIVAEPVSVDVKDSLLRPASPNAASSAWMRRDYVRLCLGLTGTAAAVLLLCFWRSPVDARAWPGVALLTILAIIVSLLPVTLPGRSLTLTPVTPIVFAVAALFGATASVVVDALSVIVQGLILMPRTRRYRFQSLAQAVGITIVTTGLSALFYVLLHDQFFPQGGVALQDEASPGFFAWAVLSMCAAFFSFFNGGVNSLFFSRYFNQRWDVVWHDNVRWMLPNAVIMSPVGFLVAVLYKSEFVWGPIIAVAFTLFPVLAARMSLMYHEKTLAAYKQGVELLGRVMQDSHPYTHGHLHRVARWAKKIAEELRLPPQSMQFIEDAAILHDIGKVAVDDRILNKIGPLSEDDWASIHQHPVIGADLVDQMSFMDKVAHWIRHHHERPDGNGYPSGLRGDEIPIESCIISVVDAFDAMVGGPAKEDQRPYRKPLSREAAVSELQRHAGTQFDVSVVNAFVKILEREGDLEANEAKDTARRVSSDDSLWATPPTATHSSIA